MVYRITVTRTSSGTFTVAGPTLESSNLKITVDLSGQHGGEHPYMNGRAFWEGGVHFTTLNGWDYSTLGTKGHPILSGLDGQ